MATQKTNIKYATGTTRKLATNPWGEDKPVIDDVPVQDPSDERSDDEPSVKSRGNSLYSTTNRRLL